MRLHAHADTFRCAGGDHIAYAQGHELRHMADDLRDIKDHIISLGMLAHLAINAKPKRQIVRVGNFIFSDDPRPDRPEARGRFAFDPLAAAVNLKRTFRDIINHAIPGDRIHGVSFADIGCLSANDDAQFNFPVRFLRSLRDRNVVIRGMKR